MMILRLLVFFDYLIVYIYVNIKLLENIMMKKVFCYFEGGGDNL